MQLTNTTSFEGSARAGTFTAKRGRRVVYRHWRGGDTGRLDAGVVAGSAIGVMGPGSAIEAAIEAPAAGGRC